MSEHATETRGFQAEVSRLLRLMIHSMYSHREIFLRELISNASDACDRLRFAALAEPALAAGDRRCEIRVDFDSKARMLTVSDSGIGMTREEAAEHLGTIAKSGTAEFFARSDRRRTEGQPADRPVRRRLLFGIHRCRPRRGPFAPCRQRTCRRRLLELGWRRRVHARDHHTR